MDIHPSGDHVLVGSLDRRLVLDSIQNSQVSISFTYLYNFIGVTFADSLFL